MSSTFLEQSRTYHEDIERLEKAAVETLLEPAKTHKDTIIKAHLVNKLLEKVVDRNKKLSDLYRDEDGSKAEDLNSLACQLSSPNAFSIFYDRLREIKEYHRKFPNVVVERPEEFIPTLDDIEVFFTGEEANGKFLDLHIFFEKYINLPHIKKIPELSLNLDYLTYLKTYFKFDNNYKDKNTEYIKYLQEIIAYHVDFLARSQPLFPKEKAFQKIDDEFEEVWKTGFTWPENKEKINKPQIGPAPPPSSSSSSTSTSSTSSTSTSTPSTTTTTTSSSNTNTTANGDRANYCTHCKKQFFKDTVYRAHLKEKKHLRNVKNGSVDSGFHKNRVALEFKLARLAELLSEQIENTKENIEKKQARNYSEIAAELEHEEEAEESESEEEEEEPRGIQNYPVGWDGKPIPYWLYKLHGLGIEYKCEICGNTSYWGRRAFERHFQEWRHAHGMRCLKIPNTRHFHEITTMEDAVNLYKKIKADQWKLAWKSDVEEEFEDSEGNVFSKKTYEDLQRQGLI